MAEAILIRHLDTECSLLADFLYEIHEVNPARSIIHIYGGINSNKCS